MSWNGYESNVLLRNEGCGEDGVPRFTDVAMAVGVDDIGDARGFAAADFDNDGDLDLAVNHNPGDSGRAETGRARLYINHVGELREWLAVELRGTRGNRDAVGAVVTVRAGEQRLVRRVDAGSGYASQHSRRLYFGLGEHRRAGIAVRWPSGAEDLFEEVAARRLVRIVEGEGLEVVELPAVATEAGGATR